MLCSSDSAKRPSGVSRFLPNDYTCAAPVPDTFRQGQVQEKSLLRFTQKTTIHFMTQTDAVGYRFDLVFGELALWLFLNLCLEHFVNGIQEALHVNRLCQIAIATSIQGALAVAWQRIGRKRI